jgi:hypothetical protein
MYRTATDFSIVARGIPVAISRKYEYDGEDLTRVTDTAGKFSTMTYDSATTC